MVTELMVESLQEINWVVDREIMMRGRSCWVDGGIRGMGEVREWTVGLWRGE